MLRAYVDTGSPEAREWAESTYESYRDEARLLAPEGTKPRTDTAR